MGSRLALTLFISATEGGPELVATTTTEAEALTYLQKEQVDVLLCTDRLEQGNGGSLVAAAKQLPTPPSTLMIVTQPRRLITIRKAQRAGCDGLCLESQIGHGTVLRALGIVTEGAMYLEQGLSDQYFRVYPGLGNPPLAELSARELQVLELITAGVATRDIAAKLFISPETVKSHLAQIYRKLPAHDRKVSASVWWSGRKLVKVGQPRFRRRRHGPWPLVGSACTQPSGGHRPAAATPQASHGC